MADKRIHTLVSRYLLPELRQLGMRKFRPGVWTREQGDTVWSVSYEGGWAVKPELDVVLCVGYRALARFYSQAPQEIMLGDRNWDAPVAIIAHLLELEASGGGLPAGGRCLQFVLGPDTRLPEIGEDLVRRLATGGLAFFQRFSSFDAMTPIVEAPAQTWPEFITMPLLVKLAAWEWLRGKPEATARRLEDAAAVTGPIGKEEVVAFGEWLKTTPCGVPHTIH